MESKSKLNWNYRITRRIVDMVIFVMLCVGSQTLTSTHGRLALIAIAVIVLVEIGFELVRLPWNELCDDASESRLLIAISIAQFGIYMLLLLFKLLPMV